MTPDEFDEMMTVLRGIKDEISTLLFVVSATLTEPQTRMATAAIKKAGLA